MPTSPEAKLGASLVTQPPGIATPLHRHTREAEAFYVLDGSLTYRAGDEIYHLVAGSFIFLPAGIPHAFRITGTTPARFLGLTVPGKLLDLYDEVGIPALERRLPGDDGLSMETEIGRWNEVGPATDSRSSSPPARGHLGLGSQRVRSRRGRPTSRLPRGQ